jgi:hypothetical protein
MASGVASWPRLLSKSANQARPSFATVSVLICLSGLKRCSSLVRPTESHWVLASSSGAA